MTDHGKKATPIPNTPRITMRDAVTGERAELFDTPGYIPTPEDVEAVIAERGRWGDAPSYVKCAACEYPIFGNDERCAACNAPREQ